MYLFVRHPAFLLSPLFVSLLLVFLLLVVSPFTFSLPSFLLLFPCYSTSSLPQSSPHISSALNYDLPRPSNFPYMSSPLWHSFPSSTFLSLHCCLPNFPPALLPTASLKRLFFYQPIHFPFDLILPTLLSQEPG